jgi:hypothetical protein
MVYGLYPSSEEYNIKNIKKLKSQRFGSWLCFRSQVNGGGEHFFSSHLRTEAQPASEKL